jgi:hypothetical protein
MEIIHHEEPSPIVDMIQVISEHPTYDFQVGNLVALVSNDSDPFWLAEVTTVKEDSLEVIYYHHGPIRSGRKLVWKKHTSEGTCGKYDVYVRFKSDNQLFTKTKTIRKKALQKISQACLTYNDITVADTFK